MAAAKDGQADPSAAAKDEQPASPPPAAKDGQAESPPAAKDGQAESPPAAKDGQAEPPSVAEDGQAASPPAAKGGRTRSKAAAKEERDGVPLTNLDEELFPDAGVTKRDLVDYLDVMHERLVPVLRDRPLSVIRVLRGQDRFMQKNLPKYTPDWIPRTQVWAEASHRSITYALGNDRRTLLWFGNQRAVEYHPTLMTIADPEHPTHLIMDLDPPEGGAFELAVGAAHLVRRALADAGLEGAVKTSGSKGLHVFVPLDGTARTEDVAAATRAVAVRAELLDPELATTAFIREDRHGKVFLDATRSGGASVAATYSPRARPGLPVSFPVGWDRLGDVVPADFTVRTAPALLAGSDPWREAMPAAQRLPEDLVAQGHTIPVARVAAMHEGKRRARARRAAE